MATFLLLVAIQLVASAIGLLVAAWLVDGLSLSVGAFFIAVAVFAATTATVQYAPTRQQLLTSGAEPQLSASSEAFGAMVKAEVVKWAAVVRSAGLKKE